MQHFTNTARRIGEVLRYQQFPETLKVNQDVLVSTIGTNDTPTELRQQFEDLAASWRAETVGLSSPRAIAGHPAYERIIGLGEPVIPLILQDMKENGGWWYPALRSLTGENPVPESAKGSPPLNDEAWLQWGLDNGYV